MGLPRPDKRFDAAAYLAWEETQAERHEYLAGEVFAMVGVRQSHNIATLNLSPQSCAVSSRAVLAGSLSKPSRRGSPRPIAFSIPTSSSPAMHGIA
jgi:hypothetical protein